MDDFLAGQAVEQAQNAENVRRQMEDIRLAMEGLTEQAEVSKRMARKVTLDKSVASVKLAWSRRSVC